MIPEAIKSQLLITLKNDQEPDLPTVYQDVCEELGYEEEPEDLYDYFKATYSEIIESDWWQRVQQEHRANLWYQQQIEQTDRRDYLIEKNKTARKYG